MRLAILRRVGPQYTVEVFRPIEGWQISRFYQCPTRFEQGGSNPTTAAQGRDESPFEEATGL